MPAANSKNNTRKAVAGLVVVAAVIWTAGLQHRQKQQDATIDWHQVSTALMEVESAKRDLHHSLQERLVQQQRPLSLRQ